MERDHEMRGSDWDQPKGPADFADFLAQELYGRNAKARDLLGGSNAKILKDAVTEIRKLRNLPPL